jgi:integrase
MSYSIIAQLKFRKPTDHVGIICIRGFIGRKPAGMKSTGHRCSKDNWDLVKREVKPTDPNAQLINLFLSRKVQEIQKTLLEKELMGALINKYHVRNAVHGSQQNQNFIEYCKRRIVEYKNNDTARWLMSQCDKINAFHQDVSFYDIDNNWLCKYKRYMEVTLKNKPNTVWSSLKFVNTMIKKALKEGGIIAADPFLNFDRGKCMPSNKQPLTMEECNRIYTLLYCFDVDEKTKAVACRFLLMIYSGMRFSDAMKFDAKVHVKDGRLVMTYKKWNETVNFSLYKKLNDIIDKLEQYPLSISNTDFNRWLKIVAALCKITKPLSSHIGRHTLGFLLSDMNIPKEKARKILGHRDIRSTDIYYHVTDDQVDREVSKLNVL